MPTVRIYQPLKSTMQAGPGKASEWLIAFESTDPLLPDPLMGWTSSRDMNLELCLSFPSLMKAIEFSRTRGFHYTVYNPTKVDIRPKNYALNFTCPRVRGE